MQSLQALMQQLERSPQWRDSASFRKLLAIWPELVGTAVAQHSQPYQIQRDVLQVAVSSAAWAQTLTFERQRILTKLHAQVPDLAIDIRDIRFAPGRWQQLKRRKKSVAKERSRFFQGTSAIAPPTLQAPTSFQPLPKTPEDAFQQWSERLRTQYTHQSICPQCQRPCPSQELKRWPACAICMTHHWQNNLPNG